MDYSYDGVTEYVDAAKFVGVVGLLLIDIIEYMRLLTNSEYLFK